MKRIFIFLLFVVCARTNAQFIIAGQYSATDCYIDVVPDTTLIAICAHGSVTGYSPSFSLDINCDMIADCVIGAGCSYGLGGGGGGCSVNPLNGAQIYYGKRDTCFSTSTPTWVCSSASYPKSFVNLDTIWKNGVWVNNGISLSYYQWGGSPYACGCSGGTFSSASSFIGIRIPSAIDTTYGWIRIKGVTAERFTIEEYSSNKNYSDIRENSLSSSIRLYPNPTSDKVEFVLSIPKADLEIRLFNSLGQIILEDKKTNSNKFSLDVSNYQNGIYFVEVESKQGISRAKFVKN